MMRKVVTVVAGLVLAVGVMSGTGCSKKFSCKNFASKVKKCKKEIIKAAMEQVIKEDKDVAGKMSPEEMKKLRAKAMKEAEKHSDEMMKELSSGKFIKECKKAKAKELEPLKKCYAKSSCKEFAKCLAKQGG